MSFAAWLPVLVGLIGTAVGVRSTARKWSALSEQLGFWDLELSLFRPAVLRGTRGGCAVKIHQVDRVVVVEVRGARVPGGLELGAENLLTRTVAPDILTGDETFDRSARILGSEPIALALLGSATRAAVLREVVEGGARLASAVLSWRGEKLEEVPARVAGMVDLAERLALPGGELADHLAGNAAGDPDRGVRLRNLRALQEHFPGTDACRRACEAGLEARRAELRAWSAVFLVGGLEERGAPGPDPELVDRALTVLVDLATARNVPESVNGVALRHLIRPGWKERAIPALEEACGSGWPGVRRLAIEGLGRFRHRPAVPRLVEMTIGADDPTAKALAVALERIGDPAGEEGLARLLRHRASEVRLAAIRALGRMGTIASVEPLLEVAGALRLGREARLAREAKDRIQGRVQGAEVGQLSLARPAELEGALSPAPTGSPEGAVSLVGSDDPEGRVRAAGPSDGTG